ncbi:MAG TPA: SMP-30/gluconolactonase/LRE family protein, partial [Polyangiaceae bacterium]|nr:SMP-30/gluconolactonase/LRE family protein [Polyangiaceae bacterium]
MRRRSFRVSRLSPASLLAALLAGACAQTGMSTAPEPDAGEGGNVDDGAPGVSSSGGSSSSGTGSTSSGSGSSGAGGSDAAADAGAAKDGPSGSPEADAGASGWTCPAGPFPSNPIPAGATPTRVAGVPPPDSDGGINGMGYGFSTIEGPVWVGSTLYVSEFGSQVTPPPSRILALTSSGGVTVTGPAGWNPGTNGLAVDRSGVVYGAVHGDGSISRLDLAAGMRTPIASSYPAGSGTRFNAPNDLAIRSDGTIYFSDPAGFQSPNPAPQAQERVYRIAPGTNAVSVVDPQPGVQPLNHPNGVTLSLDEKTLYVSSNSVVYAYAVNADGSTGPRPSTPFSTMNIDGMVIDCAGNLYGAVIGGGTVQVWSPSGATLGTLTVSGVSSVTNVAFGGADHKTLYITAQGSGGGQQPPGGSAQGVYQVSLLV